MMTAIRIALLLAGAFLAILGAVKIWWEIKAWEVLSTLELRPPTVDGKPRMGDVRIYVVVAAVGVALAAVAVLPWIW